MSSGYNLFPLEVSSNSSGPTETTNCYVQQLSSSTRSSVAAVVMVDKLGAGHLESYLNERRQK